MKNSVVISGLGVISPIGIGLDSYWKALLFDFKSPEPYSNEKNIGIHYPIKDFKLDPIRPLQNNENLGNSSRLSIEATKMALEDSGLLSNHSNNRIGVCVATNCGDADLVIAERDSKLQLDVQSSFIIKSSASIANFFGFNGPNLTVSTACSAGLYSVCLGVDLIEWGMADIVIAGGSEVIDHVAQACFYRLGAIDSDRCRPFDKNRNGTVTADGAAIIILESEHHARRRGHKKVYATIKGFGWSCDGFHPTSPEPTAAQIELAIRRALKEASLEPEEIDALLPHGTGTILNDLCEGKALERVFGDNIQTLVASAIKSKIGHSVGAAGAFSCLTAALMLSDGVCPPTANLSDVDPSCPLNLHTHTPLYKEIKNILINAFAFGGNNASLILGR
jgi:3-oxoacyl-[acyl-carrier-protein] synthase II